MIDAVYLLFPFDWCFLCTECHASSSLSWADHPHRSHALTAYNSSSRSLPSSSPSYYRSSRHRSTDRAKSGGEGRGRLREAEPLPPKPNVAKRQVPTVGARRWKRRLRRDGRPGGTNYTQGRMLQNRNTRFISLSPYKGYTVT